LLDGIDAWFHQRDFDYTVYPSTYHGLCREQAKIGWRQFFSGRFSEEWAYLQDDYLYINKKHQGRDDGNNWTTAVICECWKNWYSLWEMRNLVIHGRNVAEVNQLKRRYAVQDLNAII
jgi:hypothetical protein